MSPPQSPLRETAAALDSVWPGAVPGDRLVDRTERALKDCPQESHRKQHDLGRVPDALPEQLLRAVQRPGPRPVAAPLVEDEAGRTVDELCVGRRPQVGPDLPPVRERAVGDQVRVIDGRQSTIRAAVA